MQRAIAGLVILMITGAQPAYVCVLVCLLNGHAEHGHMQTAMHAPEHTTPGGDHGGMHHTPSTPGDGPAPCHTNNFTAGTLASIAPISVTVGAVGVTLTDVVAARTPRERPENRRVPENGAPPIESPPPRV